MWIGNGARRGGSANRDAPKVGWCSGRQPAHLGFTSAGGRAGL